LFRFIDTVAPDIVIATEVGLGEITALHKRQAQANYSLVGVVAFAFDRPWAQPEFDLFLSSPGEIAAEMRIAGVPSEKICECGMPVLPPFKMPGDWLATRARLGLEYDVPVLLVDFGGSGKRMWQEVVIALWKIQRPLQIVFLSRRSETLYKELLHSTAGMERTRVLPWVDNMYDWMGVADLLVCRAGGCTIAEALNSQLPMLVFGPPPGDERRHCRLIESSWEAGYWAKRPGDLPALLDRLLDHPEEIQRLRANALRQARPQAAYDAAKAILKLRGLDQQ
jgi:processive 1,2-diacylglycerol beta-glucosyltransferase